MKFFSFMLPFWYPMVKVAEINTIQPRKLEFFHEPWVVYRKNSSNYIVHSDICPHQGASLSKGRITKDCYLQCPYHGFEFDEGRFLHIPNPMKPKQKSQLNGFQMSTFQSRVENDLLFVRNNSDVQLNETIFFPPEEYDVKFRGVSGIQKIKTNYISICENLLDMLHISYVHSFGSRQTPLPTSMNFSWCGPYHGRSTFFYKPNKNTISYKVGLVNEVKVENEFILPTNTITRVFAGNTIKTVFTRTIPINENESFLYWKIYRNFWMNSLGDWIIDYLMRKTIQEDVWILKNVYHNHRDGKIRTRYDKTILEFRKIIKKLKLYQNG